MNNELQEHKTSDKIKWICTLVAFIIVGVMLIGIICGMVAKKDDKPSEKDENEVVVTLPETNDGIKLTKTILTAAQYSAYGVSPQAESAFTITATVTDEFGQSPDVIQQVTYTMGWASNSPENINDYVTMDVNGTSATFACLKGFNTQIIVTCASVIDSTKSATATLDYAKRIIGVTGSLNGEQYSVCEGDTLDVPFSGYGEIGGSVWESALSITTLEGYVYSPVGTVNDSATSSPGFVVEFTDEFISKLNQVTPYPLNISTKTSEYLPQNQKDILTNLIDIPYTPQNFGNWYYVMRALEETTNQIKVTVRQSLKYTESGLRVTYYLNCKVPETKIGNVDMDAANHTF